MSEDVDWKMRALTAEALLEDERAEIERLCAYIRELEEKQEPEEKDSASEKTPPFIDFSPLEAYVRIMQAQSRLHRRGDGDNLLEVHLCEDKVRNAVSLLFVAHGDGPPQHFETSFEQTMVLLGPYPHQQEALLHSILGDFVAGGALTPEQAMAAAEKAPGVLATITKEVERRGAYRPKPSAPDKWYTFDERPSKGM